MPRGDKGKPKRRWWLYVLTVIVLAVVFEYVLDFFPEEQKELRSEVRRTVKQAFPEHAAQLAGTYGLTSWGKEVAGNIEFVPERATVVLVHGLDDPGKVWTVLAPNLAGIQFNVLQMRYPNDQPIVESAAFFRQELHRLFKLGVGEISIVAHSMGGLVSREVLTSVSSGTDGKDLPDIPNVMHLVMVGTPNHGSELARFRILGELREQWVNSTENRGHILAGIMDGAGEAKIDLLPGSQFLSALNSRPHPENVEMLVIAGVVNPWNENDIRRIFNSGEMSAASEELAAWVKTMNNGLGDGLVTVESTRLEGVGHMLVNGSHLSMIRNMIGTSERIPPAVPLIMEALTQQ
jgi:hypothetical protein